MSKEPPKIVSLHTGEAYRDPGERIQPAVNGVDELSLETAQVITNLIKQGEAVGLVAAMIDPKTGYPIIFTQFPPDSLPRRAALEMMGLCEAIKMNLLDIAEHGLDAMSEFVEVEEEPAP